MSKNQSIKSFFTSAQNAKKPEQSDKTADKCDDIKIEKIVLKTPDKVNKPLVDLKESKKNATPEPTNPKSASKRTKSSDKAAIKPAAKTTKKESKKNAKKILDEDDDDIIIDEKENEQSSDAKQSAKSLSPQTPEKAIDKQELILEESDSDDSPIKKSSSSSSKRKMFIESSSDEADDMAAKKKDKKASPKLAQMFTKPAAKKSEPVQHVKAKEEVKSDTEIEEVKIEEVEVKKSPKTSPKASPKSSPKVKQQMKLVVKPEEEKTTTFSKSTSNFFAGKKNETANKESQISVSASSSANKQTYNPNMENYHPIDDACWSKGEPVPYKALAQTLYAMEQTTKRLELLSIVCNYFRSVLALTPKDLVPSMYLLTNKVAPDYDTLELGIGDTVLFKALAEATGCTVAKLKLEFQTKGDIGLVAEANRCNQKLIFTPKKLTIAATFSKLREIASISGNSSQSKKCDLIKSLLVSCDSIEARYLMRSLAGKLRNGLGENSILSALAHACTITPPVLKADDPLVIDYFQKLRKAGKLDEIKEALEQSVKQVKHAYNQCPNYDRVVNAIISHGIDHLEEHCKLTPGVPLKPMLANPTKGVQEILKRFDQISFTCEYKYDGERAQIHILDDGSIQVFSRNSENNTSKYPDIIESLKTILNLKSSKAAANTTETTAEGIKQVKSAILDAEVVAYDTENKVILPFQVLSTRKRKDANAAEIKIQVCIFAFDLIMLNGESLIDQPFRKRREYLYEYFPYTDSKLMFAINMNSNDLDKIQEFLDKSVKDGCEGLMVKTLDTDAHYEISKRSHNWLKLKKDYLDGVGDTLDLVVIGGYLGTGKRTGVYGGYLLACYDQENEEYQTICKIGTGFKDEDLQNQFESLTKIKIDKPKSYYRVNESIEMPDHWFEPEQVWEIKCADFSLSPVHTAAIGLVDPNRGMSMRFPRYLRTRDDKKAEQATTSEQVTDMYKNQQQMINQNEGKAKGKKPSGSEDEEDE